MTAKDKSIAKNASVHSLLTPENCTLIFIDHQPQMLFGVANIERQVLVNNVVGLAKAGKAFDVPTILTTVETESFSGFMWPQLLRIFPGQKPIERSSMNSWEDKKFVAEVERIGRKNSSSRPCGPKPAWPSRPSMPCVPDMKCTPSWMPPAA